MATSPLSDLLKLTPAERIQLAQDLWDSIPEADEVLPLLEKQREELERRHAAHEQDPTTAVSYGELRSRLHARFGA